MNVKYYGLSCFAFKFEDTVLVTDPYDPKEVGLSYPLLKTNIVLYSQPLIKVSEKAKKKISVSEAREKSGKELYVIHEPGEYEIGEIFVRVLTDPGVVIISMGEVNICYIGPTREFDSNAKFDALGMIHYLVVPVGDGKEYMDWKKVDSLVTEIDPGVVLPSCFFVDGMAGKYADLRKPSDFLKEAGVSDVSTEKKLKLVPAVPSEDSQYKAVVLEVSRS